MDIASLYELYLTHPAVTTDSRHCPTGSLFFALRGEKFDGNEYASLALRSGCAAAVVDRPEAAEAGDSRYIIVDNALLTLQALARHHRRALGTRVIQITGTNGKTTTKELIAAVLSKRFRVLHTEGNLNNHIGVPLTLLRLTRDHDIAVVETGANHPGEIKTLTHIVEPDCGIITNVGRAHLEGFGSIEGVMRTKGELYDYLREKDGAFAFVNADNPRLRSMLGDLRAVRYGTTATEGDLLLRGKAMESAPFLTIRWQRTDGAEHITPTRLIGAYNTENLLAAACIGLHFGVGEDDICRALADYTPTNSRSELRETRRNHLIVDAYNANPTSMTASLRNFFQMKVGGKMVILGEMRELGDGSREEHEKIVRLLEENPSVEAWLVGGNFRFAEGRFRVFGNVDEVTEAITANPPQDRWILIKGSNATRLHRLPPLL